MKKKYNLNLTEIGKRLKQTRDTLNMTLEKMHNLTGFSTSLISAAENGQKKPSAIYLFALLEQFNVNLNYIFSGKGEMFLSEKTQKDGKIQFNDTFEEMIYMLENVEMVRYAMLSEFISFKIQHASALNTLLEGKKPK